ncbi:ABC transporter transmembrane domain-containing protein [Lichenihabitans psoromatis]|uniref:ABC transporter transmembrane domain-containing protein n=1 Tax=Lichenihabitans psoromatis TaxID=2528642 RepID=UPI0010364C84|nr:ABC transporter transmembrane domain-containing protein [Lichenihabitans psoromatis]
MPTPWRRKRHGTPLDGKPLPKALFGLAWRLSAGDQVWLCLLSISVALLDTAPIEVQRRMINHAIKESGMRSIIMLALTYAGLVLAQGLTKLLSNIYRSWVSEHGVRVLRSYINDGVDPAAGNETDASTREGTQISMIVAESEPIGAFVGESLSEPLLQAGIMVSVVSYLVYLQPVIALVLLGVYGPQVVFVPLIQRAINRRAQARIATLREASAGVLSENGTAGSTDKQEGRFERVFELNMGVYKLKYSMNFLMNLCHQLGIAVILGVGGWFVVIGKTEVGTVVAFISGLHTVKDPWDDLATWFQTMMVTRARYDLMVKTVEGRVSGSGAVAAED